MNTVDVTIGITIEYYLLQLLEKMSIRYQLTSLIGGGNYYSTSEKSGSSNDNNSNMRIDYSIWFKQLIAWMCIVAIMKCSVLACILPVYGHLARFSSKMFYWLHNYPKVELSLVMVLIPAIMNSIQ